MMYLRLHKGQHIDAVIPSAIGVAPQSSPGDVVWEFDADVNPNKVIQVNVPVQAVGPDGQPLFNEDGTPQYETETMIDPATGEETTQIVYQLSNKTVHLLDDPTQFTPDDFSGLSYVVVGSIEQARKQKKAQLLQAFESSLVAGFPSNADGTERTYTLDGTAYSRINGYLSIVNAGKGMASRSWFTKDGIQTAFTPEQFVQFAADAFAFYDAQYGHLLGKEAAVDEAESASDIDAIAW